MSQRLRDMVRSVRACKTAAEERTVIAKECALIRTSFKEDDVAYRHRNIAKLLLFHLMGYPTQFAQIECLKLVASSNLAEKRIGYLALTQFLDENDEVLMLVTNSISRDLQSTNQHISSLALTTFCNLANEEMCIALVREIDQLLELTNPYIKKKAILCAARIVSKSPDLEHRFLELLPSLLEDRHHGVCLATCTLMSTMFQHNEKLTKALKKFIPNLIKMLNSLLTSNSSTIMTEHEIQGINDPFLQQRILNLLRRLSKGSAKAADMMTDVLAHIATNTDGTKCTGQAVLYETILTIMCIEAESGLRVMAINLLGRFIENDENNNLRYVALSVLQEIVKTEPKTVLRHKANILQCLNDNDTSLQKRALDIIYSAIDEDNVKQLVKELLDRLRNASADFKSDLISKICLAADKFSPSRKWHIDTLILVMANAGSLSIEAARDNIVYVISVTPALQEYAVLKLYFAAREQIRAETLIQVAVWSIGEFGDFLVSGETKDPDGNVVQVNEAEVISLLESVAEDRLNVSAEEGSPALPSCFRNGEQQTSTDAEFNQRGDANQKFDIANQTTNRVNQETTIRFLLTAFLKLSVRYPSMKSRLLNNVRRYIRDASIEFQQRSTEYMELLSDNLESLRSTVVDRMPLPVTSHNSVHRPIGEDLSMSGKYTSATPASNRSLLDSDSSIIDTAPAKSLAINIKQHSPKRDLSQQKQDAWDLLGELIGSEESTNVPGDLMGSATVPGDLIGSEEFSTMPNPPPLISLSGSDQIVDKASSLLNVSEHKSLDIIDDRSSAAPRTKQSYEVLKKEDIEIIFEVDKYRDEETQHTFLDILSTTRNNSPYAKQKYILEFAVPRYMKIFLDSASSDTIQPLRSEPVTQRVRVDIENAIFHSKPIVMKVRSSFMSDNEKVEELVHIPSLYTM